MLSEIIERYPDEQFMKAEGFDDAIIGVDESEMRLVYSVSKVFEILQQNMSAEDAKEHFYFNIQGAWVGGQTPIWCHDEF